MPIIIFELLEEIMKKFWPVGLALAAALAIAPIAKADSFSINIGGTNLSGTGTITVAANGQITGGTFSFTNSGTGVAATGNLVANTFGGVEYYDATTNSFQGTQPPATDVYAYFDDLFTSTGSLSLDGNGILIALSNDEYLNIYGDGDSYSWIEVIKGGDSASAWVNGADGTTPNALPASLKAIQQVNTPEPSSLLLLGTGLFVLAGLLFWKAKSNAVELGSISEY